MLINRQFVDIGSNFFRFVAVISIKMLWWYWSTKIWQLVAVRIPCVIFSVPFSVPPAINRHLSFIKKKKICGKIILIGIFYYFILDNYCECWVKLRVLLNIIICSSSVQLPGLSLILTPLKINLPIFFTWFKKNVKKCVIIRINW